MSSSQIETFLQVGDAAFLGPSGSRWGFSEEARSRAVADLTVRQACICPCCELVEHGPVNDRNPCVSVLLVIACDRQIPLRVRRKA